MLLFFVGASASILGISSVIPQAIRLARTRRADGISLATQRLCVIGILGWVVYGTAKLDPVQLFTNVVAFFPAAAALALQVKLSKLNGYRELAIQGTGISALICSVVIWGPAPAGFAGMVANGILFTPQAWLSLRQRTGIGLSTTRYKLNVAACAMFVLYGFMRHDNIIIISALWTGSLAAVILIKALIDARFIDREEDDIVPISSIEQLVA